MRSTGLHYLRNRQQPETQTITYGTDQAVQQNPTTSDNFAHLGLDVHKETIAVATLRPGAIAREERCQGESCGPQLPVAGPFD